MSMLWTDLKPLARFKWAGLLELSEMYLIRSVDLRLCGIRRRIWDLGLQDGAAIGVGY